MSLAAKVSILINLLFQLHIFHFFYFLFYFLRLLCAVFKDSLTFKNWRFTLFESAKLPISRVDGKQNVSVQFLTFPPTTLNFQGKRGGKKKIPRSIQGHRRNEEEEEEEAESSVVCVQSRMKGVCMSQEGEVKMFRLCFRSVGKMRCTET